MNSIAGMALGTFKELKQWIVSSLVRVGRFRPSPRRRLLLLGMAATLFLVLSIVAASQLDRLQLRVEWLFVIAALALASFAVNASEYWVAGQWTGVDVGPLQAIRITVMATAANLAPLPGAVIVRARELYSKGANSGDVARSLGAIGAGWLSVALFGAGFGITMVGNEVSGAIFLVFSLAAMFAAAVTIPPKLERSEALCQVLALEAASVAIGAGRIWAAFQALGLELSFVQAIGLPSGGAIASALGLFPGGLGLRELLVGGIAPLLGITPSAAVIAAAADRVLGLGVLTMLSGTLIATSYISDSE